MRFHMNGRRTVIWPAYIEHLGRRISLLFEWDAGSTKNRSLRIMEVQRIFQLRLGIDSPVVYSSEMYQVVGDEFKMVSFSIKKFFNKIIFFFYFLLKNN